MQSVPSQVSHSQMTPSCAKLTTAANHHAYCPGSRGWRQEHLRRDAVLHMPQKQHCHITWCGPGRCTHQALLWGFPKLLLLWVSLGTAPMIRIWCLLFIEFSSVPFYTDFHHWKFLIRAWNSSAGALVWDKIHTSSPWPLVNMELSKFSFPEMLPIFIRTSLTCSDMNEAPINPGKSRYSLF